MAERRRAAPVEQPAPDPEAAREMYKRLVVGYDRIDPRTMEPHPLNPKVHPPAQLDTLDALLRNVGVAQNVVWNRRTNHVIDGHARRELALANNEADVDTTIIDCDEPTELVILATFDPVAMLATVDDVKMREVLAAAQQNVQSQPVLDFLNELAQEHALPETDDGFLGDMGTGDSKSPWPEDSEPQPLEDGRYGVTLTLTGDERAQLSESVKVWRQQHNDTDLTTTECVLGICRFYMASIH